MDVSRITDQIFVGARPRPGDAHALRQLDLALMIRMLPGRAEEVVASLGVPILCLPTRDNLFIPIPLETLEQGVRSAVRILDDGGRVLTYCREGRHRSVAMAASILIARGMPAEEAADLLKARRRRADPYSWHIWRRIRAFETRWKDHAAVTVPA
jgi:protein tyrosine phosphatase (PTP) superfamily phosphohydrolase (DUF442 family)